MDIIDFMFSINLDESLIIWFYIEMGVSILFAFALCLILIYDLKNFLLLGPVCYLVLSLVYFCYMMINEYKLLIRDPDAIKTKIKIYWEQNIEYYSLAMYLTCMVLKLSIATLMFYYRKFYLSLQKRISNEVTESFLTNNNSYNISNSIFYSLNNEKDKKSYLSSKESTDCIDTDNERQNRQRKISKEDFTLKVTQENISHFSKAMQIQVNNNYFIVPNINTGNQSQSETRKLSLFSFDESPMESHIHDKFETPKSAQRNFFYT
jgi:hypothetical protein